MEELKDKEVVAEEEEEAGDFQFFQEQCAEHPLHNKGCQVLVK